MSGFFIFYPRTLEAKTEKSYHFWFLFCFAVFCFLFLRQALSMSLWQSWDSMLTRLASYSQRSACSCHPSAGIKGVCHHARPITS